MNKHDDMRRFAPAVECLEDRRVLSLLGSPVETLAEPESGVLLETHVLSRVETPLLNLDLGLQAQLLPQAQNGGLLLAKLNVQSRLESVLPTVELGAGVGRRIGADIEVGAVDVDLGVDVGVGGGTPIETAPTLPGAGTTLPPVIDDVFTPAEPPVIDDVFTPAEVASGSAIPTISAVEAFSSTAILENPPREMQALPARTEQITPPVIPESALIVAYQVEAELESGEEALALELADDSDRLLESASLNDDEVFTLAIEDDGLLDPTGLAAAELAIQQVLHTLSGATEAFLSWFAMLGPAPWIMMGLAALATLSEVTRLRLEEVRRRHRFVASW